MSANGRRPGRRVLVILEGGDIYPSGFIRGLIYREYFQEAGFEATFVSRMYPPLLRLAVGLPAWLTPVAPASYVSAVGWLAARLADLTQPNLVRMARDYDVVYMSKVMSFSLISALRRQTRARLVLDFGDAMWLPGWVSRFNELLSLVDAVTTDNELTADYVRKYNPHCVVIPDSPQVEWFDKRRAALKAERPASDTVVLGWVGTPATLYNLYVVWEALEHLFARHPNLHLRLVGTGSQPLKGRLPNFERVRYSVRARYSQAEMIEEVMGMDIGLFPLQDVEASRVRGVLKATVYMAGEAAVVCSPVGLSADLIQDGVNGFLASTPEEWEQKLEQLVTDHELRHRLAQAGLETVRRDFMVKTSFARLASVLVPDGQAEPLKELA